jgi:hypothetical protein
MELRLYAEKVAQLEQDQRTISTQLREANERLARISHQDLKRAGDQEKSCRDRFLARSERRCEQLCVRRQRFQGC